MKVRSKALLQFLMDRKLLGASEQEIVQGKREYRKLYKAEWKRNRQKPVRELRPQFTLKQFVELKAIASGLGYKHPTKYLKQLALSQVSGMPLVKNPDVLRQALQHIGIAISLGAQKSNPQAIQERITEVEKILLQYVEQ